MKKRQKRYTTISEFESKVYKAVKLIPSGQTRSYKWVAQRIGCPRSYRAVGNALNKNPYPVAVPCHRVIRKNGDLGGFSKGRRAKKRLLSKEGIMV
jgi:O-6-methylguanine DNA methyltransferase